MPSPLFARITTCSEGVGYLRGKNENFFSSYQQVLEYLPTKQATTHRNTNFIKASLEFLKDGFVDRDTSYRKVRIALYVSICIGSDEDDEGLAMEVCKRFQRVENFEREVMTKIFNFSLCNPRVMALLDAVMLEKTKKVGKKVDHELRVEFVTLFVEIALNLLRRGEDLSNLHSSWTSPDRPLDMELVWESVNRHASSVAIKWWPCFYPEALKKPRPPSNLFPAGGAFPVVRIGREHVDFDNATVDTLKNSLLENKEREEFLEIVRAVVFLPRDGAGAVYRSLKSDATRSFFLENILNSVEGDDIRKSVLDEKEQDELCAENARLRKEVLAQEATIESLSEKLFAVIKEKSTITNERDDLKEKVRRLRNIEAELKWKEDACREFHTMKKSKT